MSKMNIEKNNYLNILFGYYQPLLTEKQQEIFEDYYGNDYSLSEIADTNNISRNAVHDTLKKVEKLLMYYEEKLRLAQKEKTLIGYLDELAINLTDDKLTIIQKIKELE